MLVRFLGFATQLKDITKDSPLSMDAFISRLMTNSDKETMIGEHGRFLYVKKDHHKEYYVGLLITVKDQKKFCELARNGGKLAIKVKDVSEESKIMDFNFFVIHKKTGFGMYQHYHQSCSANSFGHILTSRFVDYRKSSIETEIEKIPTIKKSSSKEKEIRKQYAGRMEWSILVKKENIGKLMKDLDEIKSFEYSFLYLDTDESEFEPLKDYVRKEQKKMSFVSKSPVKMIANAVQKFASSHDIDEGKILGLDVEGHQRIYRITNNPDNFGEFEYDTVADKINSLDIDEFEKSWVVSELINKCKVHAHIFEAKAK